MHCGAPDWVRRAGGRVWWSDVMRPVVLMRWGGVFTFVWIVAETWPASLLVGIAAVVIWAYALLNKSARPRSHAAVRTAAASSKPADQPRRRKPVQRKSVMPTPPSTSIASAIGQLPPTILARSGSLFYSGPSAFTGHRPLYILGLNPGGSPITQADETVERDVTDWKALSGPWSAYLDESWQGRPPGTHGMQPRMRHMFDKLDLDLREVPSSNVVFVRSANEAALAAEKARLLSLCWPMHEAVMHNLCIRTVLCLGITAGRWVRDTLGAHQLLDRFSEQNGRGWTSEAHLAADGRAVITVTHPGRADWRNAAADPTPLVRAVIERNR